MSAQHELDLAVVCKRCNAATGAECVGLAPGVVHFGRRLRVLMQLANALRHSPTRAAAAAVLAAVRSDRSGPEKDSPGPAARGPRTSK